MQKNIKYCSDTEKHYFAFDHVKIYWNEQVAFHQQKTWELSYVITGRGTRIIGDTIAPFSRGEVVLIPPDIPHCWSFDESVADEMGKIENVTIVFSDSFLENCVRAFPGLYDYISRIKQYTDAISFKGKTLEQLRKIMTGMISETEIERLASQIKLLALVASIKDISTIGIPVVEDKKTKRIQLVRLYVINNYQRDITLDEIARYINLSKSSFCIFFKKMTGESFFSFLTGFRIESSCQMLKKTNLSVSEICFSSGFRDIPYFNRIFKKVKKMTPSQYRNITDEKK